MQTKPNAAVESTPGAEMPTLLLRSKLHAPQLPSRHVSRPRLVDLMRLGRERRLTLVCAPPGYGKTALLAERCADGSESQSFAWVSLDRGDSDAVRLWSHVIAAVEDADTESSQTPLLPVQLEIHPGNLMQCVLPLLLDALGQRARGVVLVLDDYHFVDDEVCDASLAFLVEHLPANTEVIVSSRSAPGLPLGRLRAHGDLLEIGAEELRLTAEESALAVEAVLGAPLSDRDLATLDERTEGWPAGVHLAALRLQRSSDPAALITSLSGSNRYVFEYLETDLLAEQSDGMRTFLRRTSILGRLSPELCDAVTETAESRRFLLEAERANLFLVPLDDRGEWSRYHRLFSDVLQRDLDHAEQELVPMLHRRASDWFELHGDVEAAVDHAISARDVPRASDLIARHARAFVRSGRILTVRRWIDALAWPKATADAQLAVVRALILALMRESTDVVERWLAVARSGAHEGPLANAMPSIEFGVALIRGLFLLGDVGRATASAELAAELVPPEVEWRLEALLARGQTLYLSGRTLEARGELEEALVEAAGADAPQSTANVFAYLALIELDRGELERGETLARRSLALMEERGLADQLAAGVAQLAVGVALGARGAFADAEAHVRRGAELRAQSGPSVWHAHALVLLARSLHALGGIESALHVLGEAKLEVDQLRDAGIVASLLEDTECRLRAGTRPLVPSGEELSERELVILRLLAAGLTKPEIANELYIAYNTVKTHTRTIYRKLGASRRGEAVEQARSLGLL
jgi:ATP/maltotriose-dependent transcriptional regulator MalT